MNKARSDFSRIFPLRRPGVCVEPPDGKLKTVFASIVEEAENSNMVSVFYPPDEPGEPAAHQSRVSRPRVVVRSRTSYRIPAK